MQKEPHHSQDKPSQARGPLLRRAARELAIFVIPSVLIVGGLYAVVTVYRQWIQRVNQRWNDADERHSRWGPARAADRFVMIEMEGRKADSGRYPDRLTLDDVKGAGYHVWYYRVTKEGGDYELWCRVARDDGAFDALVFSPDGVIGDDWPGDRSGAGGVWALVEHAELAPADRWRDPVNP